MGAEVAAAARERGHEVAFTVDPTSAADYSAVSEANLAGADCVVEFALPEGVEANARAYAAAGVPAVVGTTGWDAQRDRVRAVVDEAGAGYLYGSNFSLGANLLFVLSEYAAGLFDGFDEYDVFVQEAHHARKKDSPSGTAVTIGEKLLAGLQRKERLVTETLHRAIAPGELQISSVRGGAVPGQHRIVFDSFFDSIEISHTARNRRGFAGGAVRAAEWLVGRSGFFTVDDFIRDVIAHAGR
jgi:4-hydroxy-tetrahydrodipicolinate reductase